MLRLALLHVMCIYGMVLIRLNPSGVLSLRPRDSIMISQSSAVNFGLVKHKHDHRDLLWVLVNCQVAKNIDMTRLKKERTAFKHRAPVLDIWSAHFFPWYKLSEDNIAIWFHSRVFVKAQRFRFRSRPQ